jgi:hypothetical protein
MPYRYGQALRGEPLDLSQLGNDPFEVYFLTTINFPSNLANFGRGVSIMRPP